MRVLLLNQYLPPDTSATAPIVLELAKELGKKHQVTVVAGRPSYDPTMRHPYYLLRRERYGAVDVHRVGSTAFHRRSRMGRIANYLSYLILALVGSITIRPKPDVIIAVTDPPMVALVGTLVSLLRRSKFVYNIRDLHPDMAIAAGVLKDGLFTRLWERLHRWALKRADLVIVLGEDMRERVLSKGVAPERTAVVRDGAWPQEPRSNSDHPVVREIREGFDFVMVHAGNLGFAGCWDTLIEAARRVESDGVGLVFIGDGVLRRSLEERARGMDNVRFLPFYPLEEVPQVLASADLHVVTVRPGLEGLVVPSKLYPILMAGRPVLAVAPSGSDSARIVTQYGCGLVARPDDPESVVAAVRCARSSRELQERMREGAREAGLAFARDRELSRFADLLEGLAGGR